MAHPATVGPYPYFPLVFDKAGQPTDPGQLAALLGALQADEPPITDLVVVSHGWNNDQADAEWLYEQIFRTVGAVAARETTISPALQGRHIAVAGVLWPSAIIEIDPSIIPQRLTVSPQRGAVLSVEDALDRLESALDDAQASASIARARQQVATMPGSEAARNEFVDALRDLLPNDGFYDDPPLPDGVRTTPGTDLLARLGAHVVASPSPALAATSPFARIMASARDFAYLITFYQMKARAGTVGENGVHEALRLISLVGHQPVRVHLVGHSFGARVVTAATASPATQQIPVQSVTLLQAAFSHYSFAENYDGKGSDGYYRRALTDEWRLLGPLCITFSTQDLAVGLGYPIASRLAHQTASVGEATDVYGGLGRNGAQRTPEATTVPLGPVETTRYQFQPRRVYNLDANAVIMGHSDVAHDQVAYAMLSAMVASAT